MWRHCINPGLELRPLQPTPTRRRCLPRWTLTGFRCASGSRGWTPPGRSPTAPGLHRGHRARRPGDPRLHLRHLVPGPAGGCHRPQPDRLGPPHRVSGLLDRARLRGAGHHDALLPRRDRPRIHGAPAQAAGGGRGHGQPPRAENPPAVGLQAGESAEKSRVAPRPARGSYISTAWRRRRGRRGFAPRSIGRNRGAIPSTRSFWTIVIARCAERAVAIGIASSLRSSQ
jgi:hypothetical protein